MIFICEAVIFSLTVLRLISTYFIISIAINSVVASLRGPGNNSVTSHSRLTPPSPLTSIQPLHMRIILISWRKSCT